MLFQCLSLLIIRCWSNIVIKGTMIKLWNPRQTNRTILISTPRLNIEGDPHRIYSHNNWIGAFRYRAFVVDSYWTRKKLLEKFPASFFISIELGIVPRWRGHRRDFIIDFAQWLRFFTRNWSNFRPGSGRKIPRMFHRTNNRERPRRGHLFRRCCSSSGRRRKTRCVIKAEKFTVVGSMCTRGLAESVIVKGGKRKKKYIYHRAHQVYSRTLFSRLFRERSISRRFYERK